MLREYERIKDMQKSQEQSLNDYEGSQMSGFKSQRGKEYDSLQEKKSEYKKIAEPTFNNKIRQKSLKRSENGMPMSKVKPPSMFIPINPAEAKTAIKGSNFDFFTGDYERKRKNDYDEHLDNKAKMIGGAFKAGNTNQPQIRGMTGASTRLRKSGQFFINQDNNYRTFL